MTYRLLLSDEEMAALAWIANRYTSAAVLCDHLVPLDDNEDAPRWQERPYDLPEYAAWAFREAVDAEDSKTVPCAGNGLAEKLQTLLNEIV